MNKATLIKSLNKKYPKIGIMADGNGWIPKSDDSFVISAEDGIMDHRGYDMFNYWTQNYEYYEFGVSTELTEYLEKHGWYCQWVNPGVVSVYKD